jgi:TM2 domain-containing membrane protein YozV
MSGFGRKNIAAASGTNAMPGTRPVVLDPAVQQLAAQREAFLASERARRANETPEPGISSYAATKRSAPAGERSIWLAYLWWFILGQISLHRFYLGATQSAMIQVGMFVMALLFTFTGLLPIAALFFIPWCLWLLGDAFLIPGLHRRYCAQRNDVARVFD